MNGVYVGPVLMRCGRQGTSGVHPRVSQVDTDLEGYDGYRGSGVCDD